MYLHRLPLDHSESAAQGGGLESRGTALRCCRSIEERQSGWAAVRNGPRISPTEATRSDLVKLLDRHRAGALRSSAVRSVHDEVSVLTSPAEEILVRCPNDDCRVASFLDWRRASINAALDPELAADREYLQECSSATCPVCATKVELDLLVVRQEYRDGQTVEVWESR